jgi:hypothetical protein
MKLRVLILFLFYGCVTLAQDKITFSYDVAGNQIRRYICIGCTPAIEKQALTPETLTEADLIKSDVSDQISYYPNPVREELYVKWTFVDDKKIENISVYNMNGALLQQFTHFNADNLQTIPFSSYPEGMYEVVLTYSNGEKKSLKIVKK